MNFWLVNLLARNDNVLVNPMKAIEANGIFVHYHITVPFFELIRIVVDEFIRFINSFQYSFSRRLIHINITRMHSSRMRTAR